MARPVLGKHRIQLETGTAPSFFYLDGQNVARGYLVEVVKTDGSDGFWSGKVTKKTGDVIRCMVKYDAGSPPAVRRRASKRRPVAGDLLLVNITITNDTNPAESDTINDVPAAQDP